MQLSFRLDKRPGESHLALDGKKSFSTVFKQHGTVGYESLPPPLQRVQLPV